MDIMIPVSLGELIDKLTILDIKLNKIKDESKLELVRRERLELIRIKDQVLVTLDDSAHKKIIGLESSLFCVNLRLWQVEDSLRELERTASFNEDFIHYAREVYKENDTRFKYKKEINELGGSNIQEVKSYAIY